ncbi:hypothetical protein [Reyranella sp.]|uniref:hypothetical protein n=1 Tax=Reyranella sp. TaxID=1929291 RepID=UPI003D0CD794
MTALGAFALGAAIGWAGWYYRRWRRGIGPPGARPTDYPPAADPERRERYARMEREAMAEAELGDPGPTRPRDVGRLAIVVAVALVLAITTVGVMWAHNADYGTPVAETGRR